MKKEYKCPPKLKPVKWKGVPKKLAAKRIAKMMDLTGVTESELQSKRVCWRMGLDPRKVTPETLRMASEMLRERQKNILRLVARLGGEYNGKRVWLDPDGEPTFTKPSPKRRVKLKRKRRIVKLRRKSPKKRKISIKRRKK